MELSYGPFRFEVVSLNVGLFSKVVNAESNAKVVDDWALELK